MRAARTQAGLSQRKLAVALGYAVHTPIVLLEQEARPIEIGQTERLAQALGVSAPWLAFGVDGD